MADVHKSVLLGHSAEQMYDLVTRVEDYPKFLPWCGGVEVFEQTDTLLDAAHFHGAPEGVLSGPLLTQVRGRSGVVTVWFWRDRDRPGQTATKAEMID